MESTVHAPVHEERNQPSIDERRALIDRIAASTQFRRATRLRDFLLYVGGQSLKQGCPEIHEQEIGNRVFGRSASYDRSQDNIVRVNATELRKRIEQYFVTEGAHEPLILEIPRGAYKPIFYPRPTNLPAPSLLQPEPEPTDSPILLPDAPPARTTSRTSLLWPLLSLALAIGCIILFLQNRALRTVSVSTPARGPAVAALWGDFLRPDRQTDIVLPDASVSISQEILGRHISLGDYINHNYLVQAQSPEVSHDRREDIQNVFGHNLVTLGDFHAAQHVLGLAPGAPSLHLTLSRFYPADSIKRNHLVLIGGKKANPWVRLFDDQMNFSVDYDSAHSGTFIVNRHPKPGEANSYTTPSDPNALSGYSVVAYLPNPSHTGKVVIIAGADSDATSGAAEFLTSEDTLEKFRRTLNVTKFPYFEALLKTERIGGTSFNAEVVAYRTYP